MNTKFFIPFLFIAAVACTKTFSPQQEQDYQMGLTTFTVSTDSPVQTRVTAQSGETYLNNVQIAVYSPEGLLCNYGTIETGSSLQMNVPVGRDGYTVVAFVNTSIDLSTKINLSDIDDYCSTLHSNADGGHNALEMYGKKTPVTFTKDGNCYVTVSHFTAKVAINKITNSIPSNPDFTITGLYLINVNTYCNLDGTVSTFKWFQKRKYDSSETSLIKYTADIINEDLSNGESYSTSHYFYCYPNPTTTDSSSSTWCDRYTRLVVQAEYAGTTCYYPINIVSSDNTLHKNALYRITELTITGPGSSDPDVPFSKASATVTLSILDWDTGYTQTVTY